MNRVPVRRIHQHFVIATSTKLDVSKVEVPANIDDAYFRRAHQRRAKKAEGDIFAKKKKVMPIILMLTWLPPTNSFFWYRVTSHRLPARLTRSRSTNRFSRRSRRTKTVRFCLITWRLHSACPPVSSPTLWSFNSLSGVCVRWWSRINLVGRLICRFILTGSLSDRRLDRASLGGLCVFPLCYRMLLIVWYPCSQVALTATPKSSGGFRHYLWLDGNGEVILQEAFS